MARDHGVAHAGRQVLRRLRHGPGTRQYIDVYEHFGFILQEPFGPDAQSAVGKTVVWFIPDFNIGSGGHTNIFRIAWHLERMGYTCTIVIWRPTVHSSAAEARRNIREHFSPLKAEVVLGLDDVPACEFAVATGWDTAYAVRAFRGARYKTYYVQDFEPMFYPMGSDYVLAENTYRFGFYGITAGRWLADKLARDYAMHTHAVSFGVELDRYRRTPRREPQVRQVFFYARPPTPRRAFELGLIVLNEVWKRLPETRFVLTGWDTSNYRIPFPHLATGTVSPDELPDLYSQCDVALVLSLTNLSLIPLEVMACGCAVVSNRGPNVDWLLNDSIALMTDDTVEALVDAVCGLLTDDDQRQALIERAQTFACARSWEPVAKDFEAGLQAARQVQSLA